MSYTFEDLSESLSRATDLDRSKIEECVAAYGRSGDFAEWEGGFIFKMSDGSYVHLIGWCDTTGWGCQDGIELNTLITPAEINVILSEYLDRDKDLDPVDLNRYLRGEIQDFDDRV